MWPYSRAQAGTLNIYAMRQQRPRPVTETPSLYVFSNSNFDLLRTILEQIHSDERSLFIDEILKLVKSGTTNHKSSPSGARFTLRSDESFIHWGRHRNTL